MRQPCDEAVIRAGMADAPCSETSQRWILAATILGSSMAFIDGTVVNVALPALQTSLHATVVDVQWVVEAYGLFLSALILVGGALGDSFGRRAAFITGIVLFAVSSAICGFSSSIGQLIVGRCIQGVGAAFLVPSSLAVISASFDEESRGKAIGTWSGFTAITTAVGPVLGGWLIEHASWHWVFFINIPIAIAVLAITMWHVPETRSSRKQPIDWAGAASATIGLGALVYGFIASEAGAWSEPGVYAPLLIGIASLALFAMVEAKSIAPMVPLSLFRSKIFAGANLLTLLLYAALGMFFFLYPMNLIQVQHYSPTATGAAALPLILLMFLLSRWAGGLVRRYGAEIPLIFGPIVAGCGFLMFARPSTGSSYWTTFFPAFIVLGLGMTITVAPLTTVVMASVEQDRAGTASGINNAVARVAGVLAIAVLGLVTVAAFDNKLQESLRSAELSPSLVRTLRSEAIQLAALQPPPGLTPETAAKVHESIMQSFVYAFRIIMLSCALLAFGSALVAKWMIRSPGAAGVRVETSPARVLSRE